MSTTGGLTERFRQPEYTGENRCIPCTVVNTIIAVVLAAGISLVGTVLVTPTAGAGAGIAFLVVSLLAIYLRGYLVPGTPELTKQYFPPWLLELFGKAPESVTVDTDLDPEQVLVAADAIGECEDEDDLCLTARFREQWYDEIERVETAKTGRQRLLELLGVEEGSVEFEEYGDAFQARLDGNVVGRWESEAAFYADLGAASSLESRVGNWDDLSIQDRSQLLSGLRIFIDTCPTCGGIPELETETVESCCSTHEVAAVSCRNCEARLFESPV